MSLRDKKLNRPNVLIEWDYIS